LAPGGGGGRDKTEALAKENEELKKMVESQKLEI
jgi:hypothetical protein